MKRSIEKCVNPMTLAKVAGAGAFATLLICGQAQAASLVYEFEGIVDPTSGAQSIFDVGTGTTTSVIGDTYRISFSADTTLPDESPAEGFGVFSDLSATIEFSSIATVFNLDSLFTLFSNEASSSSDNLLGSGTRFFFNAILPDGTLGDGDVLSAFAPVDPLSSDIRFFGTSANGGTSILNISNRRRFDSITTASATGADIPEPSAVLGSLFALCAGAAAIKKKRAV